MDEKPFTVNRRCGYAPKIEGNHHAIRGERRVLLSAERYADDRYPNNTRYPGFTTSSINANL
ncbi:hypothetical protein QE397_002269 [Rhodococcus sp. SORGH_AS 301]|nr:hypothetical protein [Rhodococcus sp. SORGH_AS_0301]